MEKRTKTVYIYNDQDWSDLDISDWNNNILDFQKWINDLVEYIPEEHIEHTIFRTDAYEFYDSATATIEVKYDRLETDEEYQFRLESEHKKREQIEANEREQLRRLKEKYSCQQEC